MYYVYQRHLSTERDTFLNTYDSPQEAVHKIMRCYKIDENMGQKGEYYYFMCKR